MRTLGTDEREHDVLQRHIAALATERPLLSILEAGCGREWCFRMGDIKYELTGVDLDAAALDARVKNKRDLNRAIVGDLRDVALDTESYDVVYNGYVLEHIRGAEAVLDRFVSWLKPGGIVILTIPDRDSVHGFMTRLMPFFVHVLYYRWAWGMKDAGKPGFAPYPTYYDDVVSSRGIRAFARSRGLIVREEIGFGTYRRGNALFRTLTPIIAKVVSSLTLGRVHSRSVDLGFVLEKPA